MKVGVLRTVAVAGHETDEEARKVERQQSDQALDEELELEMRAVELTYESQQQDLIGQREANDAAMIGSFLNMAGAALTFVNPAVGGLFSAFGQMVEVSGEAQALDNKEAAAELEHQAGLARVQATEAEAEGEDADDQLDAIQDRKADRLEALIMMLQNVNGAVRRGREQS